MTQQTASVGRIVHLTLSETDAEAINRRRNDAARLIDQHRDIADGKQIHVGNRAWVGDVLPAIVVRVNGADEHASINGQVFLDGNDTLWVTSRAFGDQPGQWFWPPRV